MIFKLFFFPGLILYTYHWSSPKQSAHTTGIHHCRRGRVRLARTYVWAQQTIERREGQQNTSLTSTPVFIARTELPQDTSHTTTLLYK